MLYIRGQLGNKMFSYIILQFLSKKFEAEVFTTNYVLSSINETFKMAENQKISTIEDDLCQAFNGLSVIEKMDAFGLTEEKSAVCDAAETLELDMFTGSFDDIGRKEKQKNTLLIFHPYPHGYNIGKFNLKNRNTIINGINIPIKFVREHFSFRDIFVNWSEDIIRDIERKHRKKKKMKKGRSLTFVGIHSRRGDHLKDQVKQGLDELTPGYFLSAMDYFREKYKDVVFLFVSDDLKWGMNKLLPRYYVMIITY